MDMIFYVYIKYLIFNFYINKIIRSSIYAPCLVLQLTAISQV